MDQYQADDCPFCNSAGSVSRGRCPFCNSAGSVSRGRCQICDEPVVAGPCVRQTGLPTLDQTLVAAGG